jgi:uncharacterized protein YjbI with pentapeptide repeats
MGGSQRGLHVPEGALHHPARAHFDASVLTEARFDAADLTAADFSATKLDGASFRGPTSAERASRTPV